MQAWGSCKYGSAGMTAYWSDFLTLRGSMEFCTLLKALHLRVVALGVTLWVDVYFKPDEYGIEESGFGWVFK
jgi:hypothetical protein